MRDIGLAGTMSGCMFLCVLANCIDFLARDFRVFYGDEANSDFTVDSFNGVGILMGRELVQEMLHLCSDFATRTTDAVDCA